MTVNDGHVGGRERRAPSQPSSRLFEARTIDDAPDLLEQSYALRYQVYCLERKFLRPEEYPRQLEMDEFDPHSIHVGALDVAGALAGTARAVKMSEAGLPLFGHCTIFPHEAAAHVGATLVEISRLAVSRMYNRRAPERRSGCGNVFLTLTKALYQATKRMGASYWLAATEPSLQRMLAQHGLPFRPIGPVSDYFGAVAPYRMSLAELDDLMLSNRFPVLQDFVVGLEPGLGPRLDKPRSVAPPARPRSDARPPKQLGSL